MIYKSFIKKKRKQCSKGGGEMSIYSRDFGVFSLPFIHKTLRATVLNSLRIAQRSVNEILDYIYNTCRKPVL